MKSILTILVFVIAPVAFAQTESVSFRASDLSAQKFQGHTLAEGAISFAQFLNQQSVTLGTEKMEQESWGKVFELKATNQNQDLFKSCGQIVAQRYNFDWPAKARDIISFCLNEMAKSTGLPEQFLSLSQEARVFSRKVKASDLVEVRLDESLLKNVDLFFVNGLQVTPSFGKIRVPTIKFRFSLLSSSHHPISEFIDAAQLKEMKLTSSSLMIGNCDTGFNLSPFEWSDDIKSKRLLAMASTCTFVIKNMSIEQRAQHLQNTLASKTPLIVESNDSLLESKWFWIGVGSILAVHLSQQQQSKDAPPPSSKRGF